MRDMYEKRKVNGFTKRLRCFPYAMVIGISKSGTSDLFRYIIMHPEIFPSALKETNFWGRYRMQGKYDTLL
jgi:hypothetical protein